MTYMLTMKASFQSEIVELNKDLQKKLATAYRELEEAPDIPRGDTKKNCSIMKSYGATGDGLPVNLCRLSRAQSSSAFRDSVGAARFMSDLGINRKKPEYKDYSVVLEEALDPDQETPKEWLKYI